MIVKRPKIRPWMLKKEILILYYGLRDSRATVTAKLPAFFSILYLLSPIDLIPDFIPFFGYVDDIIIVPLLLNLSIKLLPAEVREESILKATRNQDRFKLLMLAVILIIIAWFAGLYFLIRYLIGN
jgi:uncharacterized membrane protein YkvA (DUF1232 family)